jgi:glutathione peroxidase
MSTLYDFKLTNIDGQPVDLAQYKGKVALVVNVASKCGYTKQYKGLESLYREYKDKGFEIFGFPSNDFGAQEPGTEAEIKSFCSLTYDVTFDV